MAEGRGAAQSARGRKLAALGTVVALALAGCQTGAPPPVARYTPPPPPPRRPTLPSTANLPEDQARHRIALLVPLTGANAGVGQSIANAANLAVLDTGGKLLRVTTYDTGTGAAAAAERALADGNQLILGPLLADDVRAVAAVARRARVPVIAFSNDATVASGGTYLLGFSPAQSIDRVVRYARTRGITKFAGLMPAGTYGRNASTVLLRTAEAAGGQVVTLQTYDRSPQALAAAIRKLDQVGGFEAVLIADGGRIALQAAPLLRKGAPSGTRLLGTELWETDAAATSSPLLAGAWYAGAPGAMYHQLVRRYRARYGAAPYRLASLGYDAVLLATRIGRNWEMGRPFPMAALADREGFSGVDGSFRFDRDGIADRALEVDQVAPGGATVVSPAGGFGGN